MKPLYIFDLDGTLADITHRRHFVEGPKKDWPAFFKACVNDVPNRPVINTMRSLRMSEAEIWVWSGRSDEVLHETLRWLDYYVGVGGVGPGVPLPIRMRHAGDHQPDETLKASWLAEMSPEDRDRLVAIFEDRDRVVAMWRKKGITCFQVADGNF